MASLLRQIVAGPRARHPEAGLDLCYVTDRIIATSGPSGTYPKRYYRNPLDQLIAFLDKKHGSSWAIWEFRAEGTGYPDEEVYGRIWHYPWPDHHPPPFGLVPDLLASMRDWLHGDEKRVVVVHCKAGKGRSGTASCSYLIAEEGWDMQEAIKRFTERRMKPGWGAGVSIPSQLRWLRYVDKWTKHGKKYTERRIEIVEVHAWGLRDGVTIALRGFIEEGKVIKVWHTFTNDERKMVSGEVKGLGFAEAVLEFVGKESTTSKIENKPKVEETADKMKKAPKILAEEGLVESPAPADRKPLPDTIPIKPSEASPLHTAESSTTSDTASSSASTSTPGSTTYHDAPETPPGDDKARADAIFKPRIPIVLDTNDVNLDVERKTKGGAMTWSVTTSVAHVWFNTFFEGGGCEKNGEADSSGVFEIEWAEMDGIKGSSRKGTRAFDRVSVVWRAIENRGVVEEPKEGEGKRQKKAADWRQDHGTEEGSDEEEAGVKAHRTPE